MVPPFLTSERETLTMLHIDNSNYAGYMPGRHGRATVDEA